MFTCELFACCLGGLLVFVFVCGLIVDLVCLVFTVLGLLVIDFD